MSREKLRGVLIDAVCVVAIVVVVFAVGLILG